MLPQTLPENCKYSSNNITYKVQLVLGAMSVCIYICMYIHKRFLEVAKRWLLIQDKTIWYQFHTIPISRHRTKYLLSVCIFSSVNPYFYSYNWLQTEMNISMPKSKPLPIGVWSYCRWVCVPYRSPRLVMHRLWWLESTCPLLLMNL